MNEKAPDISDSPPRGRVVDPPIRLSSLKDWLRDSSISEIDQSVISGLLKELMAILERNKQTIADDIRSDTGKSDRAALMEISRAVSAIKSALGIASQETTDFSNIGFGKMQFLSGSRRTGGNVIVPDQTSPVLSLIEKLVPSIITRNHSLVLLTEGPSIALNHLISDFFRNISGLHVMLFRDPEFRVMRWYMSNYRPMNILFSGSTVLFKKIERFSGAVPLSAETQFGYSVFASQGSDMDRLAETLALVFLDRSLQKFLRPAEIIVLANDAEYLRNRVITEIEKTDEPWLTPHQQQAETFASIMRKGKMSDIDIHFWKGYESGTFSPAVISPVSNQNYTFSTELDLPVLTIREAKSLSEALFLQAKSKNRMYSCIWTSDADLIQQAISSATASLLTVNGFPTGTEENISNLAVNGLPVRWVRSLTQFMSSNFRGLLYS